MKKKIIILALLAVSSLTSISAQNANTLYFMDEISTRNLMNPAFLPRNKSYFDFILLPNLYVGAGENAFTLKDLIYNSGGISTTAVSSQSASEKFLKSLPSNPYLNTNFRLNILNFGTRIKRGHYLIFDFNLRGEANVDVPKDVFRLAMTGTPDMNGINYYDLNSFAVNTSAYLTAGMGYSGRVHEKVTFGVKAKFLLGLANATTTIDQFNLSSSRDLWLLNSYGRVNITSPVLLNFSTNPDGSVKFDGVDKNWSNIRPAGYGASFDIGITYEPVKNLILSAAVVDLGFISWTSGYFYEGAINNSYLYDGMGTYNPTDSTGLNTKVFEEIWNQMKKDFTVTRKTKGHLAMITGRFNVGVEYGILNNKISFGVMNQMTFNLDKIYDEVTLAFNFRPCQWFKGSLSYSFLNGNWGTLGLGLNLNLGAFDLYLVSDYIPITYSQVKSDKYNVNAPLPDRLSYVNVQFGTIFNIGRFDRDKDDDGVRDTRDKCSDTNMDFLRKKCPYFKDKDIVDKDGCTVDEDHDGIPDCYDRCLDTPEGVSVDSIGCTQDTDHDGVPDSFDQCPDTPDSVQVDSRGCPLDADADGIPDYLDHCPNTPQNVVVDSVGCPVDSDNDGIADYLDRCPDTPAGVAVDSYGCPVDADGDGVPDHLDRCPETPKNVVVDSVGCPIDTDGDGVPDYLDKCPDTPGVTANNGCPELTEVRKVFQQAMTGIQFETAKAVIKKSSYPVLDQIVNVLKIDSTFNIEVQGHTDNVGDPAKNMKLSDERAAAVRQYLIDHGVNPNRITSVGYGDTKPIADNKTKKGRAQNRRVEFIIKYERVTYQDSTPNP